MSHEFACHVEHVKKGGVSGRARHSLRIGEEHSNENIDKSLSEQNVIYKQPPEGSTVFKQIQKRIDNEVLKAHPNRKIRSDANWCEEMTVTIPVGLELSRDQTKLYFDTVYNAIQKLVGERNIELAVVHYDEVGGQDHIHVFFPPITSDLRLSSKEVVTRAFLNKLHDEIPLALREKGFDVVRGKDTKGKGVHSKSVREYKKDAEKENKKLQEQNKGLREESKKSKHQIAQLNKEIKHLKEQLQEIKTEHNSKLEQLQEIEIERNNKWEHLASIEQDIAEKVLEYSDLEDKVNELLERFENIQPKYKEVFNAQISQLAKSQMDLHEYTRKYYTRDDKDDKTEDER